MRKRICMAVVLLLLLLQTIPVSAVELFMEDSSVSEPYNLLLIGVDRRDDTWNGNSDVMMLATVNFEKETVFLTSFLRDLYADIPGVGVSKLNAACAKGGAELCVETIKENYQVDIDNYAWVDFSSMREIVDILGGVDVQVDEDERNVTNGYITSMCKADEVPPEEHLIAETGYVHLDGYQAVAYARNRKSGGTSDFGRTDRQREIIMALFEKEASASTEDLSATLLSLLPYVKTDMTPIELMSLLPKLADVQKYRVQEERIPYDGEYYSQNEILIPTDMADTIAKLRATIY